MMDYTELVKALRRCADESICRDDFSGEKCPYYDVRQDSCSMDDVMHDATAAIEELENMLADECKECDYLVDENARLTTENKELQAEVKRLEGKLCDWCAVCPKERRNPDDCELLGENPVMYGPSGAKMEVQE